MRIKWHEKIYALYKGEQFVTEGTIIDIHEETGRSINFLRYMTYPIYEKRYGDSLNRLHMVPLDDV